MGLLNDYKKIFTEHKRGKLIRKMGKLADQNNYQEALEYIEKAIKVDPQYENSWIIKGYILNRLERFQEALKAHEKAIQLNPKDSSLWDNKGGVLEEMGRFEEALKCFDRTLELDPDF